MVKQMENGQYGLFISVDLFDKYNKLRLINKIDAIEQFSEYNNKPFIIRCDGAANDILVRYNSFNLKSSKAKHIVY